MINNKPIKMYNLVWVLNGIRKETIKRNAPLNICRHQRVIAKATTHTMGELLIEPIN